MLSKYRVLFFFASILMIVAFYHSPAYAQADDEVEGNCDSIGAVACDEDGDGIPSECCAPDDVEQAVAADGTTYNVYSPAAIRKITCHGKSALTDISNDSIYDPALCCRPLWQGSKLQKPTCHGLTAITTAYDVNNASYFACCPTKK